MPVWQEAMSIAVEVFHITESLPKKEDYGLTSQLRRSTLSISANIAEAFGRQHMKDKINFYSFARGSLTETQSHLEYAKRVAYVGERNHEIINQRLESLHKDLNKLIRSLKN